jgi:hypothetical protein
VGTPEFHRAGFDPGEAAGSENDRRCRNLSLAVTDRRIVAAQAGCRTRRAERTATRRDARRRACRVRGWVAHSEPTESGRPLSRGRAKGVDEDGEVDSGVGLAEVEIGPGTITISVG